MAQPKKKLPKDQVTFIRKGGKVIPIKKKPGQGPPASQLKKRAGKSASRSARQFGKERKQSRTLKRAGLGLAGVGLASSLVGRSSLKKRRLGQKGSSLRKGFHGAAKQGLTKARFGKRSLKLGLAAAAVGFVSEKFSSTLEKGARKDVKTLKKKGRFSVKQGRAVARNL